MGHLTEISVATVTSSEMSQDPSSLDVMSPRGTPFSKMLTCCLPLAKFNEKRIPPTEELENRSLPPVIVTEVEDPVPEVDKSVDQLSDDLAFDTGLLCQIAILGGVLAAQVYNYV